MAKTNDTYNYSNPFPQRFSSLMVKNNVTQKAIAEVCGVQRQSVSCWINGATRPDILALVQIAKYFNVSTDYLLGLTDYKTNNKEEEKIEDEQMKVTLTTDRGTWIVTAGRTTYLFTNSDQAFRFVEVCHKGVR